MNKKQIIEMARQHGTPVQEQNSDVEYLFSVDQIERLLAAERKRLADKIALMPFGDTAASFAVWIRNGGEG
jgi:hypothetical protein